MTARKQAGKARRGRRWLDSPPPGVAVEIAASGVLAVHQRPGERPGIHWDAVAARPLPAGVVQPGLTEANVTDPGALTAAVRQSLEAAGCGGREAALLLPDLAFRVALLEFDEIPHRAEELEALVRFRLRKTLPFDADQAALAVEVLRHGAERTVMAVMADRARLDEYEDAFAAAGGRAAAVLPAGLAAAMALPEFGAGTLLLRWHGGALTSGFGWREVPRLYRVLAAEKLTYDDLHASAAFFRDFHESHPEAAAAPRMLTFGVPATLVAQLRDECQWGEIHTGAAAWGHNEAYIALAGALAPAAGGAAPGDGGDSLLTAMATSRGRAGASQ